jgi:NADH-quinone oxidoreductase subunit M
MDKLHGWISFPDLLIWLPLFSGLVTFMLRKEHQVRAWSLLASVATLGVSVLSLFYTDDRLFNFVSWKWLTGIGASYSLGIDGMGHVLTFLTAVSFPLIFAATYRTPYKNSNVFYGLMLLSQAGLMGVFCAMDALVFYFFWELALVPVYFLCSRWGGERRIQATFKFFIYTFTGSLLMLIGIISIYLYTPRLTDFSGNLIAEHSFSISSFYTTMTQVPGQHNWLFWLFFVAFAIKMPVFPFHTWQPDTYEQAPAATTMVLSGIMVKMGVFALVRWLLPIFPDAVLKYQNIVIGLSVAGMLYASLVALRQDDLKRLVAYSSIAHIGLMSAAVFATKQVGMQGVMVQLFSHGINIIGLWIVIDLIEKQTGVRKISELGGIAHRAPVLTMMAVVIALANIALPLTNGFVGEFMMFSGLFKYNVWVTALAGLSIILAAVYTLGMIQKVFYGGTVPGTASMTDISTSQKIVLGLLVVMIFVIGIYPQPFFNLAQDTVSGVMMRFK